MEERGVEVTRIGRAWVGGCTSAPESASVKLGMNPADPSGNEAVCGVYNECESTRYNMCVCRMCVCAIIQVVLCVSPRGEVSEVKVLVRWQCGSGVVGHLSNNRLGWWEKEAANSSTRKGRTGRLKTEQTLKCSTIRPANKCKRARDASTSK